MERRREGDCIGQDGVDPHSDTRAAIEWAHMLLTTSGASWSKEGLKVMLTILAAIVLRRIEETWYESKGVT